MKELKIIVMENARELGEKVNKYLNEIRGTNEDYICPVSMPRFSNGEAKIRIMDSVRDKDLFILSDIGNYDVTYEMHGRTCYMSPDEHYQDIKRAIAASANHSYRTSLIMPLLYESRQHKRKGRESLDCALGLQELEAMGIKNFITFDAHDPSVANAVPKMAFENFYPTTEILSKLLIDEKENMKDLLVISPDMGAMERARYYAETLGCDVGCFYKRRDLTKVVNGKNPVVSHIYLGNDVAGKNLIIVDDMIASGSSVLEVARMLKEKGANKIYICATFALFTEGADAFIKAYEEGYFNALYASNVSYVPCEIKNEEWFRSVDCSRKIAEIIHLLNQGESLRSAHHDEEKVYRMLGKEFALKS